MATTTKKTSRVMVLGRQRVSVLVYATSDGYECAYDHRPHKNPMDDAQWKDAIGHGPTVAGAMTDYARRAHRQGRSHD